VAGVRRHKQVPTARVWYHYHHARGPNQAVYRKRKHVRSWAGLAVERDQLVGVLVGNDRGDADAP
jgi:hypothetical protein